MRLGSAVAFLVAMVTGGSGAEVASTAAATTNQAIQGGTVAMGDPNVVGIVISSPTDNAICTGALIGPNLVLTAHHCIAEPLSTACNANGFDADLPLSYFFVTTSYNAAVTVLSSGRDPTVDGQTWFSVARVAHTGSSFCGGDMAIMELTTKVPPAVCPLIPRVDSQVVMNETYRAVGFGITDPNILDPGTRHEVSGMVVQCPGQCGPNYAGDLEWIGGSSAQKGACEGDSGGPALDALNRVTGVVSRGRGNSCNVSAYESVFGLASWIKQQATLSAMHGSYAAAGWVTGASTANARSGYCGSGGGTGTGGGSAATGGGSATGGSSGAAGGGSAAAACPCDRHCTDVTGASKFECTDPSTATGIPEDAPVCSGSMPCSSGFTCFMGSGATGWCLKDCQASDAGLVACATGGGSGSAGGGSGSAAGGSAGSGTAFTGGGGAVDAGTTPGSTGGCNCSADGGSLVFGWLVLLLWSRARQLR